MIHKNQPTEFSYYGLYLLNYLKENHPNKADNTDFLNSRADHAATIYEQSRLEGYTTEGSQELAMVALMEGLHFSAYNTIIEVLWNEFADEIEPSDALVLAHKLLPILKPTFSHYLLSDDFAQSPDYEDLYTELTGAIVILLEHGI